MAKKKGGHIHKKMKYSDELKIVTGKSSGTRAEAVKGIWDHIKKYHLRENGVLKPDPALKNLFGKHKIPTGKKFLGFVAQQVSENLKPM